MLTSRELCGQTGLSYRRLDYWTGNGVIRTVGLPNPGNGAHRAYDEREVPVLRAVLALREHGAEIPTLREAAAQLRAMSDTELRGRVYVTATGVIEREFGDVAVGWVLDLDRFTRAVRPDKVAAWPHL